MRNDPDNPYQKPQWRDAEKAKQREKGAARHRASRHFDEVCAFAARECRADYGQSGNREWEYSVPVARSKDQSQRQTIDAALENNREYMRYLAKEPTVRVPVADVEAEGKLPSVADIRSAEDRKVLQTLARCGFGVGA